MAAADGYAQASGQVGVVNVHVAPGLANSLSILHNAARSKSPLLVTAGQQDTRFLMDEPILAGDLVRMAEQFTKWSYEIRRAEDAPVALRRALQGRADAADRAGVPRRCRWTSCGPAVEDTGRRTDADRRASRPDPAARRACRRASRRVPGADRHRGRRRARARSAVAELTALAELAGRSRARRAGVPAHELPGRPRALAWRSLPSPASVRKALEECDALLIVGANVFTWFLHTEGAPFPRGLRVIQIDDDPWEIGRSYPVALGIAADPKATLGGADGRAARPDDGGRAPGAPRRDWRGSARRAADVMARVRAAAQAEAERTPIGQAHLMHTLACAAPGATPIVVDESATSLPFVLRYVPFSTPGLVLRLARPARLGWGMGAAIGVQLGSPGRKVVATIGDGSLDARAAGAVDGGSLPAADHRTSSRTTRRTRSSKSGC